MNSLPNTIFNKWFNSYEEQSEGSTEIYRPQDYKFPLSRGRKGFEIKPNGEFISYDIGMADGWDKSDGRWKFNPPDELVISFSSPTKHPQTFRIVEVEDNILKIRK